jgi:hypothetical protein
MATDHRREDALHGSWAAIASAGSASSLPNYDAYQPNTKMSEVNPHRSGAVTDFGGWFRKLPNSGPNDCCKPGSKGWPSGSRAERANGENKVDILLS